MILQNIPQVQNIIRPTALLKAFTFGQIKFSRKRWFYINQWACKHSAFFHLWHTSICQFEISLRERLWNGFVFEADFPLFSCAGLYSWGCHITSLPFSILHFQTNRTVFSQKKLWKSEEKQCIYGCVTS